MLALTLTDILRRSRGIAGRDDLARLLVSGTPKSLRSNDLRPAIGVRYD